jgi:hypothetical protein
MLYLYMFLKFYLEMTGHVVFVYVFKILIVSVYRVDWMEEPYQRRRRVL